MAWQLIYTSAEHGLAAGRSGFCIVARHADIRERLVAELERLSVFDRPSAGQPLPVIRAHRVLTIGSESYHILSCIQDAGPDYSGRTNHIAHHLICLEHELTAAASPSLVLRRFPWRARWDEPARYFDDSERVDLSCFRDSTPTGSPWKELTGSAAHARLLIEPKARAGCYVAYSPGDDDRLLMLFHESLGRLADKSGTLGFSQVSFTTMWQVTDNPSDFAWRGCWADSPVHREAVTASATVFDLTHPSSLPTPAPLEWKTAADRATPVQAAIQVRAQRGDTGQRKSRWKKVSPSYDGLSEDERGQILTAHVPPDVLAKQRRRKTLKLLVWCVALAGLASLFLCLVPTLWRKLTKPGGQKTEAQTSQHSQESDAIQRSTNESAVSAAQPAQKAAASVNTTIQSTPTAETTTTKTENTSPRGELDQLPKLPTFFIVRPSRGNPVDVRQIITGELPAECHATFVQSGFAKFPSTPGRESLTVTKEENSVTRFLRGRSTEEVFIIDNGKLTIPTSITTNVLPTTILIDGRTYKDVHDVQLEKDSPDRVKMSYSGGVGTFPLDKLPAEYKEQFDDRPTIGGTAYDHAALWFEQKQLIILLDQYTTNAPFQPWHFGANWLETTTNDQKVAVKAILVEQLQRDFPTADERLACYNLNPVAGVLAIDLQATRQAVQKRIDQVSTDIDNLTNTDSNARLADLRSLLKGSLDDGESSLDRVALDDEDRKALGKFSPTAEEPMALWNQYIKYLRRVLEKVSSAIPLRDKLDVVEAAEPKALLEITQKLDANPGRASNGRLNRFRNAWATTFTLGFVTQAENALHPGGVIAQDIKDKERKRQSEQLALTSLPKSVADLKSLRLDIYTGKNWWPLIIFEDKPHDPR